VGTASLYAQPREKTDPFDVISYLPILIGATRLMLFRRKEHYRSHMKAASIRFYRALPALRQAHAILSFESGDIRPTEIFGTQAFDFQLRMLKGLCLAFPFGLLTPSIRFYLSNLQMLGRRGSSIISAFGLRSRLAKDLRLALSFALFTPYVSIWDQAASSLPILTAWRSDAAPRKQICGQHPIITVDVGELMPEEAELREVGSWG